MAQKGSSIDQHEPMFFIETMPSWYWMVTAVGLSLVSIFIFSHVHIPKVTSRRLGILNLFMSLIGVFPFVIYVITKATWTGTSLSTLHRSMISNSHATLMFSWAILSLTQVISVILKKYRLHIVLGKFGLDFLMPLIVIELAVNATHVFFPSKSAALAKGHWPIEAAEPTPWHLFVFSLPLSSALLTTVMIAMYWWLSRSVLHDTKIFPNKATRIRLHMTYSTLLMVSINSAGVVRWFFQVVFSATDCPKFTHDIVSVAVQQISTSYSGFLHLPLVALVYATVPLEMRKNETTKKPTKNQPGSTDVVSRDDNSTSTSSSAVSSLKVSFYVYLFHALIQYVSSFLLDIPFAFQCNRDDIGAFLVSS